MTVQTETSRSGPYAGAGTTGPFTVGFRFIANAHLRVIRTTAAGIDSTLALNTDYSVSGAGGSTGTVTLTSALASGEKLTIVRDVPFTQNADYVPGDAFPAESHEDALDLLTMQTQQLAEEAGRTLTLPATVSGVSAELPAPSGLKVLGWNVAGTAIENLDANTLASIIAYGTAASDLFDGDGVTTAFSLSGNPASINNLDVSIGGVAQRPGLDYLWTNGTIVTFTTAPAVGTDNILVRYMQALAMGSSVAADVSYTPAGVGAAVTTVQSKLRESVSVKDFGAVGDGVTDDTAAFEAALSSAASLGKSVTCPSGQYRASVLSCACTVVMEPGSLLKYNGVQNGTLLTVSGSGICFGRLNLDAGTNDVTLLKVTGTDNEFPDTTLRNVTASATSSLAIYGVQDSGTGNRFGSVRVINFANTGQANGSFPQAFYSVNNSTIGRLEADGCASVLVLGTSSGATRVGELVVKSATDNGVYQLGGHLEAGRISYHGTEEPAVFSGSAVVGNIDVYGPALMVGFQDCDDVTIGRLTVNKSADGSPGSLFRVRTGSVACGRITIGEISGKFKGSTLLYVADGTVEYLSIGGGDVIFEYDAAVCTNPGAWAALTACKGYKINSLKVEIIDVNSVATGSTIFNMTGPTSPVKRSYVNYLDVVNYAADGQSSSAATFRGLSFAKALVETSGVSWRTDIGPYIIGSIGNVDDSTNAIPTAGDWVRGKRLVHSTPASTGVEGWVCVLSGTPGTWKTFGTIAA